MNRLYQRHKHRKVTNLDGFWQFKTDPGQVGEKEMWYQDFPKDSQLILVPGCWNNELGLYHYEGAAWYRREFETEKSEIILVFHGFYGSIKVYVDGKEVGSHYGGFAGYQCLVDGLAPGGHSLVVVTDNTHNDTNTIPLSRVDWFHYGGLFRSVELMELDAAWIKDYRIDYTLDGLDTPNQAAAALEINVTVQSFSASGTHELRVYLDDRLLAAQPVEFGTGSSSEVPLRFAGLSVPGVKLWEPGDPNLYLARFELAKASAESGIEDVVDDIAERIGFRAITVRHGQLLLNNKVIRLKGVNRHDEHPDWGFAVPLKLMKKDIDIIKNLGCNAVRGSHYPNSPAFLDLLDQEGILFWEEIPMWGFPEHALEDPLTLERGLSMHEQMIKRDYHHPSIIVWGLHNEIDTRTQAAYKVTKAFAETVRRLDATRPITYATMHPLEDTCLSLVDLISINKYFGWYQGKMEDWQEFLHTFKAKLEKEGLSGRPIIVSEFGAGALYGENTFEEQKWSENFQAKYLEYTLKLFLNDPEVVGTYIWQYCDIRTARELELSRPRSFNNKGIVDEYRKPKQAYWTVRKLYTEAQS